MKYINIGVNLDLKLITIILLTIIVLTILIILYDFINANKRTVDGIVIEKFKENYYSISSEKGTYIVKREKLLKLGECESILIYESKLFKNIIYAIY